MVGLIKNVRLEIIAYLLIVHLVALRDNWPPPGQQLNGLKRFKQVMVLFACGVWDLETLIVLPGSPHRIFQQGPLPVLP